MLSGIPFGFKLRSRVLVPHNGCKGRKKRRYNTMKALKIEKRNSYNYYSNILSLSKQFSFNFTKLKESQKIKNLNVNYKKNRLIDKCNLNINRYRPIRLDLGVFDFVFILLMFIIICLL